MINDLTSNTLIAIDFDGVVIDSIEECYKVSKEVYYGYSKFLFNENKYKKLFFDNRGFVGPASEYLVLHNLLEEHLVNNNILTHNHFNKIKLNIANTDLEYFEALFFYRRSLYQKFNFTDWIDLNPITDFGKKLIGKENNNVYIVTTKNRMATEALLHHYNINSGGIYTNDEIKLFGTKGKLISKVIDEKNFSDAIFIDDSVIHLDTVKDKRIKCYFANWGYGKNHSDKPYDIPNNIL